MRGLCMTAVLLGLLSLSAQNLHAQAIAESSMTTSQSTVAAQSAKSPSFAMASPANQTAPTHLMARTGPPLEDVNRQDFEANAGEKGGKLLLRSMPSGAEIFINDRLVGRTPLLMIIAPGDYKIDMRGARQESAHSSVGVMPKQTQTVVMNLNQRYPASVVIH